MAQEIMVAGAIYEDVPSVRLPDSNGTYHPFTDTSDTTAVAADVAQGKTFHLADGSAATGTAAGATLVTKSITANGTYSAEDDNADGYSEVTVNVSGGGGGASNVVTGTFVSGETKSGSYGIISVPYDGDGYPLLLCVYVENGVYNPDNTGWYGVTAQNAVAIWTARKTYKEVAPDYSASSTGNQFSVAVMSKGTSGSNFAYTGSSSASITGNPGSSYGFQTVTMTGNDTILYRIKSGGSSHGLLQDVEYGYTIVYSE